MNDETYLGDGCFVSYDGWQLKLRTPREEGDHVVYLEPRVFSELVEYAQSVGGMKPPEPK